MVGDIHGGLNIKRDSVLEESVLRYISKLFVCQLRNLRWMLLICFCFTAQPSVKRLAFKYKKW